jgi:pimeloyl-ACP methyl ester carboxylesterase
MRLHREVAIIAGIAPFVLGFRRRRAAAARATTPGARLVPTPFGALQIADSGPRDAPPMVLLHCYTCSLRWWDAIVPLLEQRHRVVRIDLLGHGGSDEPTHGYSMDDQAAAVAAALRDLGVEDPATVVGHSFGFTVATALALNHPPVVDRLVNIGEWSHGGDARLPLSVRLNRRSILGRKRVRVTRRRAVRAQLRYAFAPGYDLAEGFDDPDQVVHDFRALTPAAFEHIDSAARAYVDAAKLPERLSAIRIPLLVIFGSEDQCYESPARVAATYGEVPGADVRTVAGAGHSPNVERPRETAELILAFAAAAPGQGERPG